MKCIGGCVKGEKETDLVYRMKPENKRQNKGRNFFT